MKGITLFKYGVGFRSSLEKISKPIWIAGSLLLAAIAGGLAYWLLFDIVDFPYYAFEEAVRCEANSSAWLTNMMAPAAVHCQFGAANTAELISTIGCWILTGCVMLIAGIAIFDRYFSINPEEEVEWWRLWAVRVAVAASIIAMLALFAANWPWTPIY